jgi:hypothetical protein
MNQEKSKLDYVGPIQYLTSYQKIYQIPAMLNLYVAY